MNTILMTAFTPKERARLRDLEQKRRHDEHERLIMEQVNLIEEKVRALKLLLQEKEDAEADDAAPTD